MDAYTNAAVWATIAQGKPIEGKTYGAAAMITDTESPPTSMAMLPTPQEEVVEQTSLPAAFKRKGFFCAACDAEDGLFDFCDACRRRAAMVRPPSASRPHVVFPLGSPLSAMGACSRDVARSRDLVCACAQLIEMRAPELAGPSSTTSYSRLMMQRCIM